jgi:hypothetical protein
VGFLISFTYRDIGEGWRYGGRFVVIERGLREQANIQLCRAAARGVENAWGDFSLDSEIPLYGA